MSEIFDQLAAPFSIDEIEWRIGATSGDKSKGMALAYIDARAVMDRLDKVVGPDKWQRRYPFANGKTCCEIGIKTGDDWVWKADGAGDTDHEGIKGAFSDAFKRAAVNWGIGRYLYDLEAPWIPIEQKGRSYSIPFEEIKKLRQKYAQRIMPIMKMKDECNRLVRLINDAPDEKSLGEVIDGNAAFWQDLATCLPGWKERVDVVIADREAELKGVLFE